MPELLKDFLLAVGGGTTVLIAVLTIFKSMFLKVFEKGIDSSFEKSLERFRNKLLRSTSAFELLLQREMGFYEKVSPIFAELIVVIQDLPYYLNTQEEGDHTAQCEDFRKTFLRYLEIVKLLKNECLIHQAYIPQSIFSATSDIVKFMQADMNVWNESIKFLFDGKHDEVDHAKSEQMSNGVLMSIATTEFLIKKRLSELSGI